MTQTHKMINDDYGLLLIGCEISSKVVVCKSITWLPLGALAAALLHVKSEETPIWHQAKRNS